ncbi:MAG: hypothetical protein IJX55_04925 [Clostridia bacterium]|nr:hypothetical protein [Clostridia bacterium]
MTRKNANKITTVLSLVLLVVSLAAIAVGITEAVLKTGGALVTVSMVAVIADAVLIVALSAFVIATRNAKDEEAAAPAPAAEPVAEEPAMEEETILLVENVDEEALAEAIAAPTMELTRIDYIDEEDEEYEEGVEVISVVWPERTLKNKLYRYSPNGEKFTAGDHVLVPTKDVAKNKDVIRKATVVHGNHKMDPEHLNYPLKNIIGIVKVKEEAKK